MFNFICQILVNFINEDLFNSALLPDTHTHTHTRHHSWTHRACQQLNTSGTIDDQISEPFMKWVHLLSVEKYWEHALAKEAEVKMVPAQTSLLSVQALDEACFQHWIRKHVYTSNINIACFSWTTYPNTLVPGPWFRHRLVMDTCPEPDFQTDSIRQMNVETYGQNGYLFFKTNGLFQVKFWANVPF